MLRAYQSDALGDIWTQLQKGVRRQLVKMPTGTGKTVMFAELLKVLAGWLAPFDKRGAQMLVIAHREELLDQAAEKIRKQNPGLMVDIEQGDRYASRYVDVVCASIQTLSSRRCTRLLRLMGHHDFRITVVDEAHHSAAASYRTVLAHLGYLPKADISDSGEIEAATLDDVELMERALLGWDAQAPKDRVLLGVTATPNRTDAIGLSCVFQSIVYNYDLKQAIDDGWLAPITPWVIETSESLDTVRTSHGDFNQKDLAESVNTERRNALAVESWQLHAGGRSTLAFTVDVQHAHDLAQAFRAVGVRASALSGETPRDERRELLASYTQGAVQVITNCMVLTEGTDLPRTSCILHAKPTKSATLYEQMTGRGLRIHPGKTDCIVLDLVDIARKHSLQTASVLYGLPPGLKTKGQDFRKTQEEIAALMAKYPTLADDAMLQGRFSLDELKARASTFDIWTLPALGDFGTGRLFKWIKVASDTFRLQYPWADGNETLQVSRDILGKWEVVSTLQPRLQNGLRQPARQRTLAHGLPTAAAAGGVAEAFVEHQRSSVAKMKAPDAAWRGGLATEKQLALLSRWHVPHNAKTITRGDASDLLDLASSRRGR